MNKTFVVLYALIGLAVFSCAKPGSPSGDLVFESVVGSVRISGTAAQDAKSGNTGGDMIHGKTGKSAVPGDIPRPGQEIRTGEKSLADMLYRKLGIIRVYQSTAVKVDTIVEKAEADLYLSGGRLLIVMDRLGKNSRFSVRTPALTVAIRGTGFCVSVKDGRTRVEVLRGKVDISPVVEGAKAGGVTWTAGPGTYVELDEKSAAAAPNPVKDLTAKETESLRNGLRYIDDAVLARLEPGAREEFNRTAGSPGAGGAAKSKKMSANAAGAGDDGDSAQRAEEDRRAKERDRAGGRP